MNENHNDNSKDNLEQQPNSPERRKVLKKAAYVAPVVISLGLLNPISSAHAWSVPPPPTNDPRFNNDPRFRPFRDDDVDTQE
jgi:hypothetical protein